MTAVLDASAAVELVMNREDSERIAEGLASMEKIVPPALYIPEVTTTLWKYHAFHHVDYEYCMESVQQALDLIDDFYSEEDSMGELFAESCLRKHPVYDLTYLVLARRTSSVLFTMDEEMKRLCREMGIRAP